MAAISALTPNVSLDIYQNNSQQSGTFVATTSASSAIQRRVSLTNYLSNLGGSFESHLFQANDGANNAGDVVTVGHQFEEVS